MKNKIISIGTVFLLVTAGFFIFVNIENQNTQGTEVSGDVYDGAGGGPWTLSGSPYIVNGDITIPALETLTIEPGVVVKINGYSTINAIGKLIAVGNETHRITITSNKTTPAPGDWRRIILNTAGDGGSEIKYCDISYAEWPIRIYSSNCNITNNTFSNNVYGLRFSLAHGANLSGNIMEDCGIIIFGNKLEYWDTHNIDTSNTVDGKPVYYWKNKTGGTVPSGAGQVILVNCTNVRIENQHITNSTTGILFGFSSYNNIIANSTFNYNFWAIFFAYSHNNTIINNTVNFNDNGIQMNYFSDHNNITENDCSNNLGSIAYGWGIKIYDSKGCKIFKNTCVNNNRSGIELIHDARDNVIFENNCSNNRVWGIDINSAGSINITVYNNICNDNGYYGIQASSKTNNNTYKNNTCNLNNRYGIYFSSSPYNIVTANNLMNNEYGIYLKSNSNNNVMTYNNICYNRNYSINITSSNYNTIHHNNIAYNNGSSDVYDPDFTQAWDNGTNFWNTSTEGNYWADWTSPDSSPPFGIVDNPYILHGGAQDYYPLTTPIGNYTFLHVGWNLISVPLIQSDPNLGSVLSSIDGWYDAVQWYDNKDSYDSWKHHKVGKPFGNDLFKLNETMGFWIHITQPGDTIFIYNGTQPTSNQTIFLHPGWNMVGYPSLTSHNITEGLNNLTFNIHVDSIWAYNSATQKWKELDPSDYFELGRGYWVHAKVECEWEVSL